ncbi:MAG: hypothetical protein J4F36_11270 [Nitrosopumilaceae archaeon]|nr:hypothetical protein [Nitrosopumilaceae archaeon]
MTTKKMLSMTAIIAVATIVASVSIVSALSVCESPNCMEITREDGTYKLTDSALAEFHDINGRQTDYIALKEQLQYLPENIQPIYIVVEGDKNTISKFVSEYSVNAELGKSTDTYTQAAGTISKANLEKYYNSVSFDDFLASGIHVAHAGGYENDEGKIGNGPLPLTIEQQNSIGSITDEFADNKVDELLRTSLDVEKTQ